MKLLKNDKVQVIAGDQAGTVSRVLAVLPEKNRVIVERVNLVKRHRKPSAQNRKGQIVDKPMPVHASNVMIADPKSGKPTRIKITRSKDGARTRVAVKSGQELK